MCVCVCVGGGEGAYRHIYVCTFGKEPIYARCNWIYGYLRNSHLCQFIENFYTIINWYMKDAK